MKIGLSRNTGLSFALSAILAGSFFTLSSCGGGGGGPAPAPPPLQTIASPSSGIYAAAQSVTLTANKAATIYYSLDGSMPSISGANTFSGPSPIANIQIPNDTNLLQFFAVDASGSQEAVKSETYVINNGAANGPGDPLNYYPVSQGNTWRTQVTVTEGGVPTVTYANTTSVSGTKVISGATAAVMRESSPENTATAREDYNLKSSNGIVLIGYSDATDALSSQVIPYTLYNFSAQPGSSFVAFNRTGLDYGQDVDGDGRKETADMSAVVAMKGLETAIVPAGTYANCARLEITLLLTVTLSSSREQISVSSTSTEWFAAGIGPVKNVIVTTGDGYSSTETEELIGYVVDGHGSGLRTEVTPSAPQIIRTGDALPFSASVYDIYNSPITDMPLVWASSDPTVAAIDANGVASALSPGVASITAAAGDVVSNPVQLTVLQSAVFGTPAAFAVEGTAEHYVSAGDLNGDGKQDLVVANSGTNTVSVLLGDGAGSFSAPASFAVGSVPRAVAIEDLNGDGKPDLAVVNYQTGSGQVFPGSVSVLPGTGTGSFNAATNYPLRGWETSVAVGDFNKDTYPDLAVSSGSFGATPGAIDILWNDGSGLYSSPTTTAYEGSTLSSLSSVTAADFDGDADLDLAFTDFWGQAVGVLLNTGTGTFGPATIYPVAGQAAYVATGDFNGDGKPDLAVANSYAGSYVSILLGTGGGSFAPPVNYPVGGNPAALAIADFNGDGKQDLAVANRSSGTVSILLGAGTGSFAAAASITVPGYPTSVTAGDFNSDGKPDLAVGSFDINTISIILNSTP